MPSGYNYKSSHEQLQAELLAMHKSLTDPTEEQKQKLLKRREERRAAITKDTGL
jgi:hypothetical protein